MLFLSQKLSPAERNYSVVDQELLAVKVALEEDGIGWKGLHSHFWFGLITRIFSIERLLKK